MLTFCFVIFRQNEDDQLIPDCKSQKRRYGISCCSHISLFVLCVCVCVCVCLIIIIIMYICDTCNGALMANKQEKAI